MWTLIFAWWVLLDLYATIQSLTHLTHWLKSFKRTLHVTHRNWFIQTLTPGSVRVIPLFPFLYVCKRVSVCCGLVFQLEASDCVTRVRQTRRPVTQAQPGWPLKARPRGEEVPQMACEVYIHCPLLNRLALMKCLMSGPLADIILPGSSAPWLPEKPPSLQPSLPPSHGLCCHPGRLHAGRCPLLIRLDSVRSDMQM